MQSAIYTIGHSTRPEQEFLELLEQYRIDILIDIRTLPRSRWNPQFNKTALEKSIRDAGRKYLHVPELGGLREASSASINLGLENSAFRGYADHMQTAQFEEALLNVIKLAREKQIALMCAEASFLKCHRKLTSDALTARKIKVVHIVNSVQTEPHFLTAQARIVGTKVTYPLDQSQLEF